MKVSVTIVNYNTFSLTSNCIRSVAEQTKNADYEIILVDNASTECGADLFIKEFPFIQLVKSPINRGFAGGNNLGIAKASGEYILLLNSDTILLEDSISKSLEYIQLNKDAGVVGCRMIYPDGKVQYTARRFRSISWELLDLFRFIPLLMPYKIRARRMLGKYFHHDRDMACDWLNGAFFLFPRKILELLPDKKLDERFFMYGEDQLWCWQTRNLGFRSYFYAGTTITHIHSGSTEIRKHLSIRRTIMKNELEILKLKKGKGLYYTGFKLLFLIKENFRNFIKAAVYRVSGKMLR